MKTSALAEHAIEDSGNYAANVYTHVVADGQSELKLTLAWDDLAAVEGPGKKLLNDLDLVVIDPNGNEHFPWTLDPAQPELPATRTQPDRLNNLEQVVVDDPTPGEWIVKVRAEVLSWGPQVYVLVADSDLYYLGWPPGFGNSP